MLDEKDEKESFTFRFNFKTNSLCHFFYLKSHIIISIIFYNEFIYKPKFSKGKSISQGKDRKEEKQKSFLEILDNKKIVLWVVEKLQEKFNNTTYRHTNSN